MVLKIVHLVFPRSSIDISFVCRKGYSTYASIISLLCIDWGIERHRATITPFGYRTSKMDWSCFAQRRPGAVGGALKVEHVAEEEQNTLKKDLVDR